MLSSCALTYSVSLEFWLLYTCGLVCLIGALINAFGAVSLGAPIGMQYVSLNLFLFLSNCGYVDCESGRFSCPDYKRGSLILVVISLLHGDYVISKSMTWVLPLILCRSLPRTIHWSFLMSVFTVSCSVHDLKDVTMLLPCICVSLQFGTNLWCWLIILIFIGCSSDCSFWCVMDRLASCVCFT